MNLYAPAVDALASDVVLFPKTHHPQVDFQDCRPGTTRAWLKVFCASTILHVRLGFGAPYSSTSTCNMLKIKPPLPPPGKIG
jgi:hypothetical protein